MYILYCTAYLVLLARSNIIYTDEHSKVEFTPTVSGKHPLTIACDWCNILFAEKELGALSAPNKVLSIKCNK